MIVFNKPFLTGKEKEYVNEALSRQTSGNGSFTKKCHDFFCRKFNFRKVLLTTSCTDALEMAALLLDIKPGDEVIMPSFTFVSTANAFMLRGAKIVFADSLASHPNIDTHSLEQYITSKTKAIVVVHYAGVAVDMDEVMSLADKHKLFVVEDAAQAINSFYKQRPLGGIGHLGCFSFHETKNIISGEGGLLVVNDERFKERAEILWEKGTNRSAFIRGEVDKYGWVDIGSSFLPSELIAAFLYAQLENLESIHQKRLELWSQYYRLLQPLVLKAGLTLPDLPDYASHNAHIFYLVASSLKDRNNLIESFKREGIQTHFHYPPLHLSNFFTKTNPVSTLKNVVKFSDGLVRLPLYPELEKSDQNHLVGILKKIVKD